MEISIKAVGEMVLDLVKGNILIIMEINMKGCGLMIENKDKEFYKCKLVTHIMANGKTVKNMEKDYINLVIRTIMKVNL